MTTIDDYIQGMPKAELHCHLDGSVPLETLKQLAREAGIAEAQMASAVAPECCRDLREYLRAFDTILQVLQTEEQLRRATRAIIQAVAAEHVRYIELRFAPLLHQRRGLSVYAVIQAVCQAIREAVPYYQVQVNLILCHMRHMDQATQLALVAAMKAHPFPEVVAFDFAGNEPDGANGHIAPVVHAGQAAGYALTLHAGECGCVHNVVATIALKATRIGHGVALTKDTSALQLAKDQAVHVEVCPTSNYQTGAIPAIGASHLKTLLDWGISCSINTDNRTVSQTTLTQEFQRVSAAFQLTVSDCYRLSLQAIEASFATPNVKATVAHEMTTYYQHHHY